MREVLYSEGHKTDQGSRIRICRYKKSHDVEVWMWNIQKKNRRRKNM